MSIWNVYFISVVEWAEGFRLERSDQPDYRTEVVARSLLSLIHGSDVPVQSTSYSGPLVVQLIAAALPLAFLFEGFRRMLLARRDAAPRLEHPGPARLLVVLALFALMVACAAAPMPLYALTNTWGFFTSTVVGELVMLAVGFAFPVASLIVVAAAHRRGGLRASTWFPVVIALLVVAIAAVAVAERGAPVMTIGIPLAALLFAGFAVGRSADAPLSAGHMLGCVALVGLIVVGGATRGTAGTIEVARLYDLGHTWLFAVMAITYAINLAVLAAAVWRLRVESRREPVPEPESA
ncbi:MAG: hypothetical protein F4Y92_03530 [Dehalococcoidia bacterium]|nr:hypothetical protein [Dehalococcoidia bacterium]